MGFLCVYPRCATFCSFCRHHRNDEHNTITGQPCSLFVFCSDLLIASVKLRPSLSTMQFGATLQLVGFLGARSICRQEELIVRNGLSNKRLNCRDYITTFIAHNYAVRCEISSAGSTVGAWKSAFIGAK